MAAGALGKNIENQAGAVDHTAVEFLLQITFLDGTQGMIEQDQGGAVVGYGLGDFIDLALAGKEGSVRPIAATANHGNDRGAAAAGEQLQFFNAFGVILNAEIQRHHNCLGVRYPGDQTSDNFNKNN